MELRFLGRAYNTSPQQISTIPSEHTACFRGQRYSLRVPVASTKSQLERSQLSASIRKYRGIAYIVEHHNPAPPKQRKCCYQ
ncbi:DUF4278 domain-containing protein [Pleurocapsales cyanobacterium LEGE 10410]|nr:DUF4278 domain-containing protein [Pleurocapsales cyanobacterium LEGE 10410]